jgi:hypothetical protein
VGPFSFGRVTALGRVATPSLAAEFLRVMTGGERVALRAVYWSCGRSGGSRADPPPDLSAWEKH